MNNLNFLTVFIGGITSFFAPCVLPLIPLYLAHLTNSAGKIDKDGNLKYGNFSIFINTSAFILGLLSVFFLMALGIGQISPLLIKYRDYISIFGGILLLLMALNQLGYLKINFLNKDRKFQVKNTKSGFIKSYLMGFFFSFSWSPCIGPILTSVVTYSLLSGNPTLSALYIIIYALGFILPFVLVAIFGKVVLNFFNKNKKTFSSIFETASYVLIVISLFMIFTGARNIYAIHNVSKAIKNATTNEKAITTTNETKTEDVEQEKSKVKIMALDFSLLDNQNKETKLTDFKDKYLMITFITNWCKYCSVQINTSNEYLKNHNDLEIIYVMSDEINTPGTSIEEFAEDKGIRVIKDDGSLFRHYGVYSYPNSIFIGPDSSVIGSLPGALQNEKDLISIFKKVQKEYNKY